MAFPGLFLFIFVFKNSWQKTNGQYRFCQWLDSNRRSLVIKATALQLGHNHRPRLMLRVIKNGLNRYKTSCLHTIWFTLFKWLPRCLSTPFNSSFWKKLCFRCQWNFCASIWKEFLASANASHIRHFGRNYFSLLVNFLSILISAALTFDLIGKGITLGPWWWSACSPSSLTIRVRIPQFYCKICVWKWTKIGRCWPIFKKGLTIK